MILSYIICNHNHIYCSTACQLVLPVFAAYLTPVTWVTRCLSTRQQRCIFFLHVMNTILSDNILTSDHNNSLSSSRVNEREDIERMEWEAQNAPHLCDLLVSSVIQSHAVQIATATTVHIGSKHFSDTELWVSLGLHMKCTTDQSKKTEVSYGNAQKVCLKLNNVDTHFIKTPQW